MGKVFLKVLPISLLAASAFFTFGGALGITAGWATKIGGFVSKLGITGKLGNVLSGAIVQAGRGALIGGITGAVTGQGLMKGATAGAAIGAVTGGITGFLQTPAIAGAQEGAKKTGSALMGSAGAEAAEVGLSGELLNTSVSGGAVPTEVIASAAPSASTGFERVFEKVIGSGGIGPLIQGIGGGLARGAETKAMQAENEKRRGSYDIDYEKAQRSEPLFRRYGNRLLINAFGA